ncbi:MAG: hypothetical protein SGARI_007909, partial [Bacillariaceae sp.]
MLHEITHTSIGLEDIHPPAFWELNAEIKQQYREKLVAGEVALETHDYGCNETVVTKYGQVKPIHEASRDILGSNFGKTSGGSNTKQTNSSSNNSKDDNEFKEEECGAKKKRRRRRNRRKSGATGYQSNVPKGKKPPLLKGKKMIDGRTKFGKAVKEEKQTWSRQELAARAALARFGQQPDSGAAKKAGSSIENRPPRRKKDVDDSSSSSSDNSDSESSDESSDDEDGIAPHA